MTNEIDQHRTTGAGLGLFQLASQLRDVTSGKCRQRKQVPVGGAARTRFGGTTLRRGRVSSTRARRLAIRGTGGIEASHQCAARITRRSRLDCQSRRCRVGKITGNRLAPASPGPRTVDIAARQAVYIDGSSLCWRSRSRRVARAARGPSHRVRHSGCTRVNRVTGTTRISWSGVQERLRSRALGIRTGGESC
jgi:hypothetical protein